VTIAAVVDETVDERRGNYVVAEDFTTLGEVPVAREDRGGRL
jgi:hypothetical protein